VAIGGADRVAVDAFGRDAFAAAALDRVVERLDDWTAGREGGDQHPDRDAAAGARAPGYAAEDLVDVHELSLLRTTQDAQDARHRAAARRRDRADQQRLSMAPRAVDEQRCERQDDSGEAGRQGQHGGVSWRGRHQPTRHASFVTSAHSIRRQWPKSS
jgi:hypothetical protein